MIRKDIQRTTWTLQLRVLKPILCVFLGSLLIISYFNEAIWLKKDSTSRTNNSSTTQETKTNSTGIIKSSNVTINNSWKGVSKRDERIIALVHKLRDENVGENIIQKNKHNVTITIASRTELHSNNDNENKAKDLNILHLLSQAQIPPPHSPWHVLPTAWESTTKTTIENSSKGNSFFSSVAVVQYKTMLRDLRRYVEEDGLLLTNDFSLQRLYIIRDGTLLKLSNQTIQQSMRWPKLEHMIQSALDLGTHLIKSRSRKEGIKHSSTAFQTKHADNKKYNQMGETMSDHYHYLLQWLLGTSTEECDGSSSAGITKNIPVPVSIGDYMGCGMSRKEHKISRIPWFTYAMGSATNTEANKHIPVGSTNDFSINCIPFALPCYDMWNRLNNELKYSPNDWDLHLDLNEKKFPWNTKIEKVIWRGSTTGGSPRDGDSWKDIRRFQLMELGLNNADILDFGFHKFNQGWELEPYRSDILLKLPGCLKDKIQFNDFMKYKAVLDINGNSWSSRFGHLMCLNSVVLKVETQDLLNYFEPPGGTGSSPELIPWKHYVPVEKNLSNLVEISKYVLNPDNKDQMLRIVQNANKWCQHKMTVTQFSIDTLWMILNYVDLLYFYPHRQQVRENYYDNIWLNQNDDSTNRHMLNFEWMEQSVYRSRQWERAVENFTSFKTQVATYGGGTFPY